MQSKTQRMFHGDVSDLYLDEGFLPLESCRRAFGGAVIIVASGPSASEFPLKSFADLPMITMNGAIAKFENTGVTPLFYLCTDAGFPRQQPRLFSQGLSIAKHVALGDSVLVENFPEGLPRPLYRLLKAKENGPRWFQRGDPELLRRRGLTSRRARSIGFSRNLAKGYFDSRTVAYVAMQLACHLGFEQVFLVGFDLNQQAGRFYERKGHKASPCGLDKAYERRILPALQLMASRVVGKDFRVYNVSNASRVPREVIPKVSVTQLRSLIV